MLDQGLPETTLYSLASDPPAQRQQQRRTGERHLSLLRVGTLMIGNRRELCLIRNVSAGGMMIRIYSRIEEGERLAVELRQGEPIAASVRWAEHGCIGIHFDEPVDVIRLISTSLDGPRPRMPRIAVDRPAWLRREGEARVRVRICDISQGGARLDCMDEMVSGAHVVLIIDGLAPQPAVVRWRDGGVCGVTFNRIVALPELVEWLSGDAPAQRASA